jgi:hypothetical protein
MSATTRSRARSAAAAIAFAAAVAASGAGAVAGSLPSLPAAVVREAPNLVPRGGGAFRWLGLAVYDGFLWATPGSSSGDATLALDLHYHRDLSGARIAERSSAEIAKLGFGSADERARWDASMRNLFPDVRKGDRLTGVHVQGCCARFFHNGRAIGEMADPAFARAFFAIWLDPRTSAPDFRRMLLGER